MNVCSGSRAEVLQRWPFGNPSVDWFKRVTGGCTLVWLELTRCPLFLFKKIETAEWRALYPRRGWESSWNGVLHSPQEDWSLYTTHWRDGGTRSGFHRPSRATYRSIRKSLKELRPSWGCWRNWRWGACTSLDPTVATANHLHQKGELHLLHFCLWRRSNKRSCFLAASRVHWEVWGRASKCPAVFLTLLCNWLGLLQTLTFISSGCGLSAVYSECDPCWSHVNPFK